MFQISHSTAKQIEQAIPPARLDTYKRATTNLTDAAKLYLWNAQAAGAVMELTGIVEVLLRHRIDTCLRIWNKQYNKNTDWITNPQPDVLRHIVRPSAPNSWQPKNKAQLYSKWWEKRAIDNYRACCSKFQPPNHDDLVASLNFGTWTSILPDPKAKGKNTRLRIWNDALSAGFTDIRREAVYRYSHELRAARNRAAHLRPMLDDQYMRSIHRYAIRLLRSIDPNFAQIVAGQQTIPSIIKMRPGP